MTTMHLCYLPCLYLSVLEPPAPNSPKRFLSQQEPRQYSASQILNGGLGQHSNSSSISSQLSSSIIESARSKHLERPSIAIQDSRSHK